MSVLLVRGFGRFGFGGLDHVDEPLELGDGGVAVEALLAQQLDPRLAFVDRHPALRGAIVAEIVEVDHLAYLVEAEADPLAAQDPGEPGAVAPAVAARQADPA